MSEQKDTPMAAAASSSSSAKGLDDGDQASETLVLKSTEGETFSVPRKICAMSKLITTIADGDSSAEDIPLTSIKSAVLKKVIEFMRYHADNVMKDIEKPLKSPNMSEIVSQWDADFVDVDQELLFEIILAANFLDIKHLLDLACAKVASMIKGKSPEQIRQQFNIVNDFTPEEEASVIAENKWAEES